MKTVLTHGRAVAALLLITAFNAAAEVPASAAPTISDQGSVIMAIVRLIGAFVLILAILFFGVWFYRNWQRLLIKRNGPTKLHILEAKSLGPRQSLYLIGYERQRMLVAASPEGISLLTILPDSDTDAAAAVPAPANFSDVLQKVLNRKGQS